MRFQNEEIAENLETIKTMIDDAFYATRDKYGDGQAIGAIANFFINCDTRGITRDNNARAEMDTLITRFFEIKHVLLDYVISSYIVNNMQSDLTMDELNEYARDINQKNADLDYSGLKPVKVAALAAATNTYWAKDLLSTNKKLTESVVHSFLIERYVKDKREQLDNATGKVVKIDGHLGGMPIIMSKQSTTNHIRNMMNDMNEPPYNSPRSQPKNEGSPKK